MQYLDTVRREAAASITERDCEVDMTEVDGSLGARIPTHVTFKETTVQVDAAMRATILAAVRAWPMGSRDFQAMAEKRGYSVDSFEYAALLGVTCRILGIT